MGIYLSELATPYRVNHIVAEMRCLLPLPHAMYNASEVIR